MADPEGDARVSRGYRALGAEPPPPALDEAILAAARRRRARWTVPVSIAAVVVLAVGVTLRLQLEPPPPAQPVALTPGILNAPAVAKPPALQAQRETAPRAASAPANVALGKISRAPETPEQWLERIAKLRAAGKDREADDSLAEFKRRFPDYRIPDKMRARIAPR